MTRHAGRAVCAAQGVGHRHIGHGSRGGQWSKQGPVEVGAIKIEMDDVPIAVDGTNVLHD